jgi:hypothetical protein
MATNQTQKETGCDCGQHIDGCEDAWPLFFAAV